MAPLERFLPEFGESLAAFVVIDFIFKLNAETIGSRARGAPFAVRRSYFSAARLALLLATSALGAVAIDIKDSDLPIYAAAASLALLIAYSAYLYLKEWRAGSGPAA